MRSLFRFFSWRHQRRHLLRAFLGLMSIALGVALYVSVEVAQASTVHGFEQSAKRMSGKAELRVSRGRRTGIEASALKLIEEVEGVTATPVLQRSTTFPELESGPVLVLGIDFRREGKFRDFSFGESQINPFLMNERALLVTRTFAERHGLKIGRSLKVNSPGGIRTVHIAGLIDDSGPARVFDGNLALMGIGGAQKLFATDGRVDRIDVFPASAAEAVREKLGSGFDVAPVQASNSIMEEVLMRIRSLVVVSLIAMMVGLFIIYLSVSIGVLERTKEVGTMRALGGTRAQILTLFLTEAGVLGLLGSLLGLLIGFQLAKFLIEYSATNINLMNFSVHVESVILPTVTLVSALAAGTLVSILAALSPSLRATGISPLEVLRPATYGYRLGRTFLFGFIVGAILLALSGVGVVFFYFALPGWIAMTMTVSLMLGAALMLPQVTIWLSLLLRRPLRRLFRIEGYLAADNIMKYPQRTALTVIALGGALSLMVATASIFLSFKKEGLDWLDDSLPFGLSVQATDLNKAYFSDARLPAELCDRVKQVEGVGSAFGLQLVLQEYGRNDIMILAIDMEAWVQMTQDSGREREDLRPDAPYLREMIRGEAVAVSTNFMRLNGVGPGDELVLRTPDGPVSFRVNHSMDDYSWPQGVVVMHLPLYRKIWKDTTLSAIDIHVAPGHEIKDVQAALGKALEGEFQAFVITSAQLKAIAADAVDQSFRLTRMQVVIAMVIGFLGIVNTLLISVLRRKREIGLLRSVGMTKGQVSRTVVIESVIVAFLGGVFGVMAGLVAAAFPISKHVDRTTGYDLPFLIPWTSIGVALVASLVLGFVASYLPARRAAGLNLMEAVGYE